MSSFTQLTRDAVKSLGAKATFDNGLLKVEGNVGLSTYPIHDSSFRERLNSKILREYWFYEIGVETAEMWRFNIETDMHRIMPQYNELYKSLEFQYDPMKTIDIKSISSSESESESDKTGSMETENVTGSETDSKSRAVASNYPQSQLKRNADYASSATDSVSESDVATTVNGEEIHAETVKDSSKGEAESSTSGYQAIPAELILAYRAAIVNVEALIVAELSDNFLHIYNNGSVYSDRSSYERYTI